MAGTYKPRCSSWADALRAAASLPTIRGTMGDSAGIPKPSASRSTSPHRCFRLSGSYVRALHSLSPPPTSIQVVTPASNVPMLRSAMTMGF